MRRNSRRLTARRVPKVITDRDSHSVDQRHSPIERARPQPSRKFESSNISIVSRMCNAEQTRSHTGSSRRVRPDLVRRVRSTAPVFAGFADGWLHIPTCRHPLAAWRQSKLDVRFGACSKLPSKESRMGKVPPGGTKSRYRAESCFSDTQSRVDLSHIFSFVDLIQPSFIYFPERQ